MLVSKPISLGIDVMTLSSETKQWSKCYECINHMKDSLNFQAAMVLYSQRAKFRSFVKSPTSLGIDVKAFSADTES